MVGVEHSRLVGLVELGQEGDVVKERGRPGVAEGVAPGARAP